MEQRSAQKGMNILSIVAVTVVVLAMGAAVFYSIIYGARTVPPKKISLSNIKQQAIAHLMYVVDHDGYGPSPDAWMDQLKPYLKNTSLYEVPVGARKEGDFGYAYYRPLGGIRVSEIENANEVVLAFESSDLSWNANGGFELLPKTPYHDDGTTVFSFIDGHAKALKPDVITASVKIEFMPSSE